ncbi:prolyl-tRNA synthetase [Melanomma pulvis-pyrius CBS 109.77]|uniref:proline--tRNA ligase n=1 Tax=Melanomma pulvis-pyrius CBS 109.77 TaxID=1314802 RepID=A0A6A6XSX5_9PLEO|nr:prolyl-tRNA synthetase [Melanomma pulvis-pyrius CBS 109.77]
MTAQIWQALRRAKLPIRASRNARFLGTDSRNRLSNFWAPTGGISPQDGESDDSHALLVRGGFLRQAHSGVFHLLPLGLRVQDKLERLIDKHMQSLGASKLSLSSITTEALWRQSGRYSTNSELLRLKDRKDSGFLLSPTHEEEITSLVSGMIHSYKDLPLRLYQIGRKYRDERRPRQGLLRAKEFLMKDLYTFDYSPEHALETYKAVRTAYNNLFNELKVPYLVADADSGNMGGKLSHEYHFASPKGEDNVWSCDTCTYVANEELVEKAVDANAVPKSGKELVKFTGISVDRTTKIHIYVPRPASLPIGAPDPSWNDIHSFVNLHAVKKAGVDIDTGIETSTVHDLLPNTTQDSEIYDRATASTSELDLTPTQPDDPCPRCPPNTGRLAVRKAIEVAHTFHLGTRYSEPLSALVSLPDNPQPQALQMGCHGIGISRMIGAIASLLSDSRGLNWPRVVAPFEVAVIETMKDRGGEQVYDHLQDDIGASKLDAILDDRPIKSLAWKLRDADLIGYPVLIVLGRAWKERGEVEVQCRRLGVKKEVGLAELKGEVLGLLEQL